MIKKEDIITGEKIQILCDEYFGTERNFNFNMNIKKQTEKCININKLIKPYNNKRIIFFYPICLKEKYLRNLKNPFILITHNSDKNIIEEKHNYLLSIANIIKIYSQNCTIIHTKVEQIPIGIANSTWKHGNLKQLVDIINKQNKKENDFFFNFSIKTNEFKRKRCKKIIEKKGIFFLRKENQNKYLQTLSTYKYCICPQGNGLDTHRFWECLYLDVIPIIIKNKMVEKFSEKFPVVLLNKWKDFDKEKLLKKYINIKKLRPNYKKYLQFSYIKKCINT